jgi:hypothetical protein
MNLNIDPFLHLTLFTSYPLTSYPLFTSYPLTRATPYHHLPPSPLQKKSGPSLIKGQSRNRDECTDKKNKPVQSGNDLEQVNQRKQHHWSSINGRISTVGYDWYDWLKVSLLTSPGQFCRCNIQIVASKCHSIVASAAKLARAMANHHHHPHGMQYAHWMLAFPFTLDGRQRSDQDQCPPSRGCYVMAKSL